MATSGTALDTGNQSRGLTPQQAIVEVDRTPTVFFFRWLLDIANTARRALDAGAGAVDFGDTIQVNSTGLSDDPTITVNAPPFFTVNTVAWPQTGSPARRPPRGRPGRMI